MNATLVEVFEDNAGGLKLYAHNEDNLVYGCLYYDQTTEDGYTAPELCAADFVALAVQGIDPEADGWDAGDNALISIDYDAECGHLIASSAWYEGLASDMWADPQDADGFAGLRFIFALDGIELPRETKNTETIFTVNDGTDEEKTYTGKDLAAMDAKQRAELTRNVLVDALEDLDTDELIAFIRSYEIETRHQIGDGYDTWTPDEAEYFVDWKNSASEFLGDVSRAAMEGRITGFDMLHWDEDGNLWIEDPSDVTKRAGEDIEDFADELIENCTDDSDLSFDAGYVDVPDEIQDRMDELADAYQTAIEEEA